MNDTIRRPQRPCKSYPCVLPVRATPAEKARIETLAKGSQLSASRYLVRLAIEGQAPPDEEEREDLRAIAFLLDRVGSNLNQIAHRTNRAWMYGSPMPPERDLEGVLSGVKELTREIRKRLRRR